VPATARRSLAVEPMTAPADAFNSGVDLGTVEPGARFSASWGVRALS
jgi:aldose 1-epimerase